MAGLTAIAGVVTLSLVARPRTWVEGDEMKRRYGRLGIVMAVAVIAIGTAPTAGARIRTLTVDDDGAQCRNAGFNTIQSAITAAEPGDTVRVCGGSYAEAVSIDKQVVLVAKSPAAPAVDCLARLTAYPAALAVVRGGLAVTATGSEIDGLVVTGATVGITTSDQGSGYRIRRSIIEGNSQFGIELQSGGDQRTSVERNCVRGNGTPDAPRAGIAAEMGELRNTVIRNNITADNFEGISIAGPHPHSDVTITRNTIRREYGGINISGGAASEISHNNLDLTGVPAQLDPGSGIAIGGGTSGLWIDSNVVSGAAGAGLLFSRGIFNDANDEINVGVVVSNNTIRNNRSGINVALPTEGALPNLANSVINNNVISENVPFSGISIAPGNNGNMLVGNTSTANGRWGISLVDLSGTTVVGNTMTGNGVLDANDTARSQNTWINNTCSTDFPEGTICAAAVQSEP